MTLGVVDDVILGGGCAGLSLAVAMNRHLPERRVVIVEPRTEYVNDRTWCYWSLDAHPFEDAVAHRWSRWTARYGGTVHMHESAELNYCEIPSDAFYRLALNELEGAPQVELRFGTSAGEVTEHDDYAVVETSGGPIRAQRVHDSRPPKATDPATGDLVQHFVGIRVKSSEPCFDPSTATLMDFDVPQELGIHFFYVLPYDETHALVEATFLSPSLLDAATYHSAIEDYLSERYDLDSYQPLHSEQGAIPMSAKPLPARLSDRVYRIGTAGGLVKPSTGYAFLAIQRWSDAFAQRLAHEELPAPPEPRSSSSRFLDAVFLRVLRHHPARAPELFARLFERVDPMALVRFLNDRATIADRLQVMGAMPTGLFLKEVWPRRRYSAASWAGSV